MEYTPRPHRPIRRSVSFTLGVVLALLGALSLANGAAAMGALLIATGGAWAMFELFDWARNRR